MSVYVLGTSTLSIVALLNSIYFHPLSNSYHVRKRIKQPMETEVHLYGHGLSFLHFVVCPALVG